MCTNNSHKKYAKIVQPLSTNLKTNSYLKSKGTSFGMGSKVWPGYTN